MSTFQIHVADVEYPWELSKAELKAETETHNADSTTKDDAIDEAEEWQGECLYEWARVWITRNGKTIWRNWQ